MTAICLYVIFPMETLACAAWD